MRIPAGHGDRPTFNEALALGMVVAGHKHGLDMVRLSQGALRMGSVFLLLGRLEDKGLITSSLIEASGPRKMPRRVFQATDKGRRAFAAWQAAERAYEQTINIPQIL